MVPLSKKIIAKSWAIDKKHQIEAYSIKSSEMKLANTGPVNIKKIPWITVPLV